ncbi:MAG: sensor histidine kinase [Solirubrobacteraceae bacterium]
MLRALRSWFRHGYLVSVSGRGRAPVEAVVLRVLGVGYLVLFVVATVTTSPHPGLQGDGRGLLVALAVFVVAVLSSQPRRGDVSSFWRVVPLLGVAVASAILAALQPNGIWEAGPYFVGVVAARRLERLTAVLTLAFSLVVVLAVAIAEGRGSDAVSVLLGAVPWFLVMRLLRATREQHAALEVSQAAEARAAAAAERGRLAREMHDVLAHSLSGLVLQLESTRLLAEDRGVDADVTRALDQAHHLAAAGLQEARRAIATARGEQLPGPERLPALTDAFGQQSRLPVTLAISGEPRELAPDARLAIYRTAQEALTNIRRHARATSVAVQLDYRDDATVLAVEDRTQPGATPPARMAKAGGGYGLAGMRERAELLGGRLIAEPTGEGFRVELRLPAGASVTSGARR